MINEGLAKSLLNKNVIKTGTELEVQITRNKTDGTAIKISETVSVKSVKRNVLRCSSITDGEEFLISPRQIIKIDGMQPARLASIFNIRSDGTFKAPGKKRGRKPKNS